MTFIHKRTAQSNSGFTLVELAISLMIIGLLIAGILKGAELVENARLKKVQITINSYRTASNIFFDSYGALAGDLKDAGTKIPGCTASAVCVTAGGNQDGRIGTHDVANWSADDQSGQATEATQFWVDLNLADLITNITGQNSLTWGDLYPASPVGGGFQIVNANEVGVNQAKGHYLVLKLFPTGAATVTATNKSVLSPTQLARLDTQFDDGNPNTGSIISDDGAGLCFNVGTLKYNDGSTSKDCLAAFKIDSQ